MCIAYTANEVRILLSQGFSIQCYVGTCNGKAAVMCREEE